MTLGNPKRKLRNFLLDKRFQLKYTLAVVVISALISLILGYFLYKAQQENFQAQRDNSKLLALGDPDLDASMQALLADEDKKIQEQDRRVLLTLVGFLGGLVLALTLVGIIATHKIAGPAYSMRKTLSAIADGKLPVVRELRRGDELRAVAEELHRMAVYLREREQRERDSLQVILGQLKATSTAASEALAAIQATIDEKTARLASAENAGLPPNTGAKN